MYERKETEVLSVVMHENADLVQWP